MSRGKIFTTRTGYDLGGTRFLDAGVWVAKLSKALVVAGAAWGLVAVNARLERAGGALSSPLGGETRYFRWRGGGPPDAGGGGGGAGFVGDGVFARGPGLRVRQKLLE